MYLSGDRGASPWPWRSPWRGRPGRPANSVALLVPLRSVLVVIYLPSVQFSGRASGLPRVAEDASMRTPTMMVRHPHGRWRARIVLRRALMRFGARLQRRCCLGGGNVCRHEGNYAFVAQHLFTFRCFSVHEKFRRRGKEGGTNSSRLVTAGPRCLVRMHRQYRVRQNTAP